MAQNLFNLTQGGTTEANKPLVAFKAGKCSFSDGTVTPINKKGLVQILQTPDSLLHFQWKDRSSNSIEDDLIIFPDEATIERATPDARVFLLKFTSGRKLFFWLQEAKDDKDKEYIERINQYINNPPPPDQSGTPGTTNLTGMNEARLRQMFQGYGRAHGTPRSASPSSPSADIPAQAGSSTATAVASSSTATPVASSSTATSVGSNSNSVNLPVERSLASVPNAPVPSSSGNTAPMPNASSVPTSLVPTTASAPVLNAPIERPAIISPTSSTPAGTKGGQTVSGQDKLSADMAASLSSILAGFGMPQAGHEGSDIDLQEVVVPELVFPTLSEDAEALKELFPHLPPGTQNLAGLRELLFSAQFGQTIDSFTHVINSGHANELLSMFGVDPMLAGPVGVIDMNGFITALQASIANNVKK